MNTDAAVPGLNRNNVYRLPVPWEDRGVIGAFDEFVSPVRAKIRANIEESKTLAQMRRPAIAEAYVRRNPRQGR